MPESIHYVDVAIRIQFDLNQLPKILAIGRKFTQETFQIPVDDDDPENESTRPMTDEEVAEDVTSVQDCIAEILQANPLLEQLGMDITATTFGEERSANEFEELPALDLAVSHPRHLEPVEDVDLTEEEEDPLDEFNDAGM